MSFYIIFPKICGIASEQRLIDNRQRKTVCLILRKWIRYEQLSYIFLEIEILSYNFIQQKFTLI